MPWLATMLVFIFAKYNVKCTVLTLENVDGRSKVVLVTMKKIVTLHVSLTRCTHCSLAESAFAIKNFVNEQ